MRIAILGAGSWGTTIASLVADRHPTRIWARRDDLATAINLTHTNPDYLSGYELPHDLTASSDLSEVVADAEALVIGVPSHGFRAIVTEAAPLIGRETPIISLSKGIERETLMRMTEVILDVLPDHRSESVGVLSGPNLAREIMDGQPAATVISMRDNETAKSLQQAFMTPWFRVYTNPDVVGCEIAGACKNVMAIASGMVTGLGFGDNTRATLITRALAELTRLGLAMGGNPLTFGGLAGIGDLVATCYSTQSRNHTVGAGLGAGRALDDIIAEMKMVAEGVKSTEGVLELSHRHGVEMPIAVEVGQVLYHGADPMTSMTALMTRSAKPEGHGIV
ncbi:MAG: NAD(P)-dependent glycerol-3-phosphate dehydrogenase [Acidimicrobiia bacterium]|nr:NAD(P)-dependent glycerol-3-phosphate dehydrogenase [Acidimicrobiia bacterium]